MYSEMKGKIPSLEVAYPRLRALFFAALGRLARGGFVVSPDDSMDLVHDFFAEAWAGLDKHFDANKGSFEGYAYRAFVQFARPRIVRLRRWQDSLIATEELDSLAGNVEAKTEGIDEDRVRLALTSLPEGTHRILRDYVYSEYSSENLFANKLGISRYRLRAILVDALGRLVVSFDKPSQIAPKDWTVACCLWRDGRTVQETSKVLEMTPHQVRAAYLRNVRFLGQALKHYQPRKWSPQRREKMEQQQKLTRALDLLNRALHSPNHQELLKDVRANAEEILDAIESGDAPTVIEQNLDSLPPEWVADVYQALFHGAGSVRDIELEDVEAVEAHEHEDTAIGTAFRDTLLADLTDDLRFPPAVGSLPVIDEHELARLGRAPDVLAGKPESEWWLRYGIRPVTVFYATESISGLLNRYLRRKRLDQERLVLGDESVVVSNHDVKEYPLSKLLKEEISRRAECSPEIASALYSWILEVGQRKSWLFPGFEAEPGPGGSTLRLICSKKRFEQVYQRWGLTSGTKYPANETNGMSSARRKAALR
jgi:RNA polymerase sigma factor (sigma-70 family)